jgi:hypothetical protein
MKPNRLGAFPNRLGLESTIGLTELFEARKGRILEIGQPWFHYLRRGSPGCKSVRSRSPASKSQGPMPVTVAPALGAVPCTHWRTLYANCTTPCGDGEFQSSVGSNAAEQPFRRFSRFWLRPPERVQLGIMVGQRQSRTKSIWVREHLPTFRYQMVPHQISIVDHTSTSRHIIDSPAREGS